MAEHLAATLLPLCQFLAQVFITQPDTALLQSCRDGAGARLLAECGTDPVLAPAATGFIAALRSNDLTALGRAWTLLFSGAGGPASVPPYASAYTEGRLYGAAAARMHGVLDRLDMSITADCREPPDHVAIQLVILAELLSRDAAEDAQAFRQSELAWLPDFCAGCTMRDPTGLYAAAALLLAAVADCTATAPPLE
jgi:TorA specific chaperone